MFIFRKFKTSFNVYNGTTSGKKHEEVSYGATATNGAYRVNRDEFSTNSNYPELHGKVTRKAPVPPPMPPQDTKGNLRQTKSTSDLIKNKNLPPTIQQARSGVSLNPQGANDPKRNNKNPSADQKNNSFQLDAHKRVEKQRLEEQKKLEKRRLDEQKRLEKQRLEEQKSRERLLLQEQARQERMRKERERNEAKLQKGKKIKKQAPQRPLANPMAQSSTSQVVNKPATGTNNNYSTDTLNSSISKTSGPPPYSEVPPQERKLNETNSNVQFSKPVDTGSWDLVSQHRHNVIIKRPVNPTQPAKGQTMIDLNYTLGEDKSEA